MDIYTKYFLYQVEGIPREYGGTLKNPETVVYRDDAIIPVGVIMYTRQGWDPAR